MKLRFKVSDTGWLCVIPDSCHPGEDNWVPVCRLTAEQQLLVRNHQQFFDCVEEDLKRWKATRKRPVGHLYSPKLGTEVCFICGFHKLEHAAEHFA